MIMQSSDVRAGITSPAVSILSNCQRPSSNLDVSIEAPSARFAWSFDSNNLSRSLCSGTLSLESGPARPRRSRCCQQHSRPIWRSGRQPEACCSAWLLRRRTC
jgi:hypothetical protein